MSRRRLHRPVAVCLLLSLVLAAVRGASADDKRPSVAVGSKKFTESVILGEMLALLAQDAGADAVHRRELGGTQILFKALLAGEIDAYPEYTGTLREEILAGEDVGTDELLRERLAERGIVMSASLGFNNTYALGMLAPCAERLQIKTISDLRLHPKLKFGFSNEFMERNDGWPGLRRRYGLDPQRVQGIDHDLAYRGLAGGAVDVTDLYATDAEIEEYQLHVLDDDLGHFPAYHAVLLYRRDLSARAPQVVASFQRLEGVVTRPEMSRLNAEVKLERISEQRAWRPTICTSSWD